MRKIVYQFVVFMFCLILGLNMVGIIPSDTAPVQSIQAFGFIDSMELTDDGKFDVGDSKKPENALNLSTAMEKYKLLLGLIIGIITISAFFMMVFHIYKFTLSGDNEQARRKAMSGILFCGIALALMGSASIIMTFLLNIVHDTPTT